MMTLFRLHCVVCDNSIDYFKYLLNNYRSLASSAAQIEVIAHCTDDKSYKIVIEQKLSHRAVPVHRRPEFYVYGNRHDVMNRIKLALGAAPKLGGSSGHAAGIKSAFKSSGGEGMDIIADTDTVILVPDWDLKLEKILTEYAVIGTSYEQKGGVSSGSGNIQTYKTAPNLTWMAFSSRYPFSELDPSHKLWSHLPIKTKEQAELYGVDVGSHLLRDIGWKMPQFLKDRNAKACMLENVYPESGKCKVLKTSNHYNEEFQLNSMPFIAHQRGSRKHPFKSEPLSAPFYKAVEDYLQNLKLADSA
jgi:hypothetical protein